MIPRSRARFAALIALAAAASLGWVSVSAAQEVQRPVMVVELFTSQGCNSCPPADAILGEMAQRDDVLGLSLHVDYWDYLGWVDTFGREAHSMRQKKYAKTLGKRSIYTPQMVINGQVQAVGSRTYEIEAAMAKARPADATEMSIVEGDEGLTVIIGGGPTLREPATVWLVEYQHATSVPIERGENRGKTLTYHNVVHAWQSVGTWDGSTAEMTIPLSLLAGTGGCAVIIQQGETGPILAAAAIDLTL